MARSSLYIRAIDPDDEGISQRYGEGDARDLDDDGDDAIELSDLVVLEQIVNAP